MTSGFQWLNELMRWMGRWVPRIVLIRSTHRGVLFGPGDQVRELPPGVHVFWPIWSELEKVAMTRRTSQMCGQLIGQEVVGWIVSWRVLDPVQMLTSVRDINPTLDDAAQTLGALYVDDLGQLLGVLRGRMSPFGVEVVDVGIANRGPTHTLELFKDWAHHEEAGAA